MRKRETGDTTCRHVRFGSSPRLTFRVGGNFSQATRTQQAPVLKKLSLLNFESAKRFHLAPSGEEQRRRSKVQAPP